LFMVLFKIKIKGVVFKTSTNAGEYVKIE